LHALSAGSPHADAKHATVAHGWRAGRAAV